MIEVIFGLAIVLSIIVFAVIGFISCLSWIFGSSEKPEKPATPQPTMTGDALASRRLLDHLRSKKEISEKAYVQLRDFLYKKFPDQFEAPTQPKPAQPEVSTVQAGLPKQREPALESTQTEAPPTDSPQSQPVAPSNADVISPSEVVVIAEAANDAAPVATPIPREAPVQRETVGAPLAASQQSVAPWDIPDPPPPVPRRSFAELMSGFMQEKNMRWGELTSGILIVLSAVGLVVSLREQLSDRIPYFSALLFLLITAAILGAGVYTLKKWKLRNTSRGALVIGLLLIPLNFVAACILSGPEDERRLLTDPWLWTAVIVGVTSFSAMAWWSSKYLLRRGQLPMTIAVIGPGIGALLLNRLMGTGESSLHYLLYALPVAASFVVGTCAFDSRQWVRQRWTERACNRLFLFLGVSTFATLAALSLVVVRAESHLVGLIATTPIISVVCIVASCLGSIVAGGATGKSRKTLRFAGLTLEILGMVLVAVSLSVSLSNPTVLVVNSLVAGFGLIAMFILQSKEKLFPIAWGVLAVGALAALNLATGKFGFDQWTSPQEFQDAILNGKSGLCLLAFGAGVVGIHTGMQSRLTDLGKRKSFLVSGWLSGGAIFLAGCLIALVASLLNRENVFDVMTASGLLMLAAIGSLAASLLFSRKNIPGIEHLPNAVSLLMLGGLAHCLIWNPTIANGFSQFTNNIGAAWLAVLAIHGLTAAIAAAMLIRPGSAPAGNGAGNLFAFWSVATTSIVSIGMFSLVGYQTGWAAGFAVVACISWFLIGWSWQRGRKFAEVEVVSEVFVLSTGLLVCVIIAELVSRFSWCPTFEFPRHWLIQLIGISVWAIGWSVFTVVVEKTNQLKWLHHRFPRVDQIVLFGAVILIALLICDQLFHGSAQELTLASIFEGALSLHGETAWVFAALAAIGVALLVSIVELPTAVKGAGLVGVWMLAWLYGAEPFEASRSVASAIRWLLPIGGVIGAILVAVRRPAIPAWTAARKSLKLSGSSTWSNNPTQRLINFALTIVAGVVIAISTFTISQVFLNGVDSLGGPAAGSWFGRISAEVSYGIPVAMVVGTFLLYAISERRSWLATLGSAVFQYMVVLAVVLLFLSPDPAFATERFIQILQSVAIGMTGYGFVWYWMRGRIEAEGMRGRIEAEGMRGRIEAEGMRGRIEAEGNGDGSEEQGSQLDVEVANISEQRTGWLGINWISQIEVHTLINGLLVTSLAVLAMGRFYVVPDQPGAWISSVGSVMGVVAWALFGVLAFFVWRDKLAQHHSAATWTWLVGWMGLILVGLTAAVVDRNYSESFVAWLPFRVVMIGAILVSLIQTGLIWFMESKRAKSKSEILVGTVYADSRSLESSGLSLAWPVLFSGAIALTFAVRGAWLGPTSFWLYIGVIGILVGLTTAMGWMLKRATLGFISAAIATLGVTVVLLQDPNGWFADTQPYWFNLVTIATGIVALAWVGFYIYHRRRNLTPIRRSFVVMPNVVVLLGSIWIFLAALLQLPCDAEAFRDASTIVNPLGITAFAVIVGLSVLCAWNDRARFRVISRCLLSLAFVIVLVSRFCPTDEWRFVAVNFGAAMMVAVWGFAWLNRRNYFQAARKLGATRLVALERSIGRQLPIYSVIIGVLILWAASIAIGFVEPRPHRYIAALIPFALAIGLGTQSNQSARRWLQILTLCLVTIGVLFVAWADLNADQMFELPMLSVLIRSLIVLAGAMFVYGGLVTRWVRPGDTWLKSLREMAVVTCGLAVTCLVLAIMSEASVFKEDVGCGLMWPESIAVAVLVIGMIAGLIIIAVRPENDPFALSLSGRMGYVYAAEFVGLALVAHLYFSMPWLFQIGIKAYWPYIVMAICFGGVGVAQVLEKRNLTVLGKPLFNTAAVLPVIVSIAFFAVDSKADVALVMLIAGMAYLMISYTHQSLLSGSAAILFGNLALWIVFDRSLSFSFLDHPQLWLIPPAISALIAGQLSRDRMTTAQLSTLRYICSAVIYVSSTMDIFISGVGDQLWPPVVLAILAVIGIMSGIMFRVKAFLYFGSLFLLMAMITMVAHAHQRLDHVWPWWAFGIGLGIAILVMFGLFEKKKNEMKAVANRLRDWDA